ncbi:hypothetical protein [Corynebacterium sp.]|mgnify:CR=1 FL=1|uniref:hypothetical protein n=1 Tax=Corynebacterium sp. TaxID=1720 RepID=UPI0025BA1ED0|nr:hypothetical protein [Corynebacterium sp.]
MTIPPEVWPVVGVIGAAILGFFGTKVTSSSQKAIADKPDWQGFTDQIQEWTEQRLAERDEKIERLQKDVGELRTEVSVLRRKYNAALLFIRDLVRKSPEVHAELPGEIVDDL